MRSLWTEINLKNRVGNQIGEIVVSVVGGKTEEPKEICNRRRQRRLRGQRHRGLLSRQEREQPRARLKDRSCMFINECILFQFII